MAFLSLGAQAQGHRGEDEPTLYKSLLELPAIQDADIFSPLVAWIGVYRYNHNRNKSGRCAPYKSKEIHSYESELSRADLFVFTDFVGGLISSLCGSISRCRSS